MILNLREINKRECVTMATSSNDFEKTLAPNGANQVQRLIKGVTDAVILMPEVNPGTTYKVTLKAMIQEGAGIMGTIKCDAELFKPISSFTASAMTDTIIVTATYSTLNIHIEKDASLAHIYFYDITVEELGSWPVDIIQKNVEVVKSQKDITNPTTYKGSFTQALTIVLTPETDAAMRFRSTINNSNITYYAELLTSAGLTLLEGLLHLVELQGNLLKVNIIGDTAFFQDIKTTTLKDLESGLSYNKIANRKYALPFSPPTASDIIAANEYYAYPIVNNGQIKDLTPFGKTWSNSIGTLAPARGVNKTCFNDTLVLAQRADFTAVDCFPAVSAYQIWSEIHKQQGWTWEGTILEDKRFKNLFLNYQKDMLLDRLASEEDIAVENKTVENEAEIDYDVLIQSTGLTPNTLKIGGSTNTTHIEDVEFLRTGERDGTMYFVGEFTSDEFQPSVGASYDVDSSLRLKIDYLGADYPGTYNAPPSDKKGHYAILVTAGLNKVSSATNGNDSSDSVILFKKEIIMAYGEETGFGEYALDKSIFEDSIGGRSVISHWLASHTNDVSGMDTNYRFFVRVYIRPSSYIFTTGYPAADVGYLTVKGKLQLTKNDWYGVNEDIPWNALVPAMKQSDYINSVCQMFNLRFRVDPIKKHIVYEHYDTFFDTSNILELEHVDIKSVKSFLGPTFKGKSNNFKYAEDSSGMRVITIATGYEDSKTFVDLAFGLNETKMIPLINFPLNQNFKFDVTNKETLNVPDESNEYAVLGYLNVNSYENTGTTLISYMRSDQKTWYTGAYGLSTLTPAMRLVDTTSVLDVPTIEFFSTVDFNGYFHQPTENQFDTFYGKETTAIFDPEAEVVELKVALTTLQSHNISLKTVVVYNNHTYTIDSIKGLNENALTKLRLIRVNWNIFY